MKIMKVEKGDYVLATKYLDGDPHDHFAIGFFDGMLIDNWGKITERFLVKDSNGKLFRANGFRRCEKISQEIGDILVQGISIIEEGCSSVWFWRYHPKLLKKIIKLFA